MTTTPTPAPDAAEIEALITPKTDDETIRLLREDGPFNKLRALFSSEAAQIEQAQMQRHAPSPIEVRRMEFRAVVKLAAAIRSLSRPVEATDAMVERACEAYFDGDGYQWDEAKGADHVRSSMRAAITAALGGRDDG